MTTIKSLRILNFVLFLLHFSSFVAILLLSKSKDVNSNIIIYDNQIQPSVRNNSSRFSVFEKGEVSILNLISAFFLITSLFHLFYALDINKIYSNSILNGTNPFRWLEYSLTATIMILIIALSATVQIFDTLLSLLVITVAIMLLGNCIEIMIKQKEFFIAKMLTFIAWILQVFVFVIIGKQFVSTIKSVNEELKKETDPTQIPDFVYAILGTQLIFFSSFGFIQLFQLFKAERGKPQNYLTVERNYHILSLISKLTLGWIFYYGVTQQGNRTLAPQSTSSTS